MSGTPTYSRAALLEQRRRAALDARVNLARLRDEVRTADDRLRAQRTELQGKRPRGATAAAFQAAERFRVALRERIERQRDVCRRARAAVDGAAAALAKASRALQVVERDREAWERGHRRERALRDQRGAEESSAATFRRPRG